MNPTDTLVLGTQSARIYTGDCIATMYQLDAGIADLIVADPPYFLSGTGTTCKSGKRKKVHKGAWDEPTTPEQQRVFGALWLAAARRLLKPSGTLIVNGTTHSIHDIHTAAVGGLGMDVVNEIIWNKINPPPNLACRSLQHASETLLWMRPSRRSKHFFNYQACRALTGKQMRSVWSDILPPGKRERERGEVHPTQKPVELVLRCLMMACPPGGLVVTPFGGSGTEAEAAIVSGRSVISIDRDPHWVEVQGRRLRGVIAGIEIEPARRAVCA